MRALLHLAWLLMLVGCTAPRTALHTAAPTVPGGDAVYVRVPGLPDVELTSPDGKRIRTSKGVLVQQDLGVHAAVFPVPPNMQIALLSPPNGTWHLRIQATEDRELWVAVTRSLSGGKRACDAADTLSVKENEARSWSLTWSALSERDTCWIQLARAN